jgi:hypothetical protein
VEENNPMGLGDWIRNFFSSRSNPQLEELAGFAAEHKGVEGYVEPQTATNPTTLLLVDRSGDTRRAPVRAPRDAISFCERLGIPVYDARVVGYPKRIAEFESSRASAPDAVDEQFAELERRFHETDPNIPDH